jgi:hypothetical protein
VLFPDLAVRCSVYRPMRMANSGISGIVMAINTADCTSVMRMAMPTSNGTTAAVTNAGR